ncbi:MAG: sn-glycerol-3-phosphate ABC transporter ATP-binding protein UgpC [Aerococcus sp.]|nr:sn-glycerol-3-phosphate ABC transporter ATP-binding protein UgpC [Aerococcus sp.]
MAEINLTHIAKRYPHAEKYSVRDFNIEIANNEFIVFVGPSGCGKSTTLRMIAGLETITDGELTIDGQLVNDVPPKDRDIAMVFQNYALYPHMSVYDNMAYGLRLRKFTKEEIDQKVHDAAEILGLSALLDRKPAALSGGQRQRVALGRAIVRRPKIFLMDEPLSNLDAKLRVAMRAEIAKIHQRLNTNTIYVTHDQTEAMTMADRIVVMNDGVVQQIGKPMDIYDHPINTFVAGFMGAPAMNFFNVHYHNGHVTNQAGLKLAVPEPAIRILDDKGYQDKEVILGLRPEDIQTEQIFLDANPESLVHSTVTVSELTGAEAILYSETAGDEFVARVDVRDYYGPGNEVTYGFNMNKAHFFAKDTQLAIVNQGAVYHNKTVEELTQS